MQGGLIVFDLDGTLVDTSQDIMESLNHALGTIDLAPVEYEQISFLVGQGAKASLQKALKLRDASVSDEELMILVQRLISHYNDNMPGKSKAYEGLIEALEALRSKDMRFAICTNKLEASAKSLIKKLNMSEYFEALSGGDSFAFKKPDGRHVLETIKRANGSADPAIMIGDSINDIAAARDAGIPSIAVTFGYSDVPVRELNPDHIISHFNELTYELVESLMKK